MTCSNFGVDLKNLAVIRRWVEGKAAALSGNAEAIEDLVYTMNEAVTNIIVHGYRGGPGTIEVEVKRNRDALVVCLRDHAPPFDPTSVSPPDISAPLEERPFGKMGVYLMQQLLDEVRYRRLPEGSNELTLVKRDGYHSGQRPPGAKTPGS